MKLFKPKKLALWFVGAGVCHLSPLYLNLLRLGLVWNPHSITIYIHDNLHWLQTIFLSLTLSKSIYFLLLIIFFLNYFSFITQLSFSSFFFFFIFLYLYYFVFLSFSFLFLLIYIYFFIIEFLVILKFLNVFYFSSILV